MKSKKLEDFLIIKKVPFYKCYRCGYEWLKRRDKKPQVCPRCNNRSWWKPKKKKKC